MQLHLPPILAQIAALDAQLLVISFADLPHLQAWVTYITANLFTQEFGENGLELPADLFARTHFLADPQRRVYHAYGLGRTTPDKVFGFKILRQYARWKQQGKPIRPTADDPLQQGGNFVVNRHGILTLSHTGADQSERPSSTEILAALS